jgi:hypothetical protein
LHVRDGVDECLYVVAGQLLVQMPKPILAGAVALVAAPAMDLAGVAVTPTPVLLAASAPTGKVGGRPVDPQCSCL